MDKSWSLFLDRDGVINERIFGGYVQHPDDFVFLPGVPGALAVLSDYFGKIVVVTNQQGIGKGLMNVEALEAVHRKMLRGVTKAGGRIDAVFFCPDLESAGGNCRKPSPFMAFEARKQFPEIDFSKSIMVGDAATDMVFGRNAGMFTVLLGPEPVPHNLVDLRLPGLPAFAQEIQKNAVQ